MSSFFQCIPWFRDTSSILSGAPVTQEMNVQITCSSDEGAALVLPTGASSQDLTPLSRFLHHIHNSAAVWFSFLEEWGFAGNCIYLVTGCHKSSGWGITFSAARSGQGDVNMTLGSSFIGGKLGYSWENSTNSESSHAGPLRELAEEGWGQNQCVFIRGYVIVKRDRLASLWRKPIKVKATEGSPDVKSSLRTGGTPGTPGAAGGSTESPTSRANPGSGSSPSESIEIEMVPGTNVVSLISLTTHKIPRKELTRLASHPTRHRRSLTTCSPM